MSQQTFTARKYRTNTASTWLWGYIIRLEQTNNKTNDYDEVVRVLLRGIDTKRFKKKKEEFFFLVRIFEIDMHTMPLKREAVGEIKHIFLF